jgi:hypothetical protein
VSSDPVFEKHTHSRYAANRTIIRGWHRRSMGPHNLEGPKTFAS